MKTAAGWMSRAGLRASALVLGAAAVCAVPMLAQESTPPPPPAGDQSGPPPGGMRGGRGMNSERQEQMLTERLSLTPDQVTKLKAIDAEQRTKMMALREDTTTPEEDKRKQMMGIMKAREDSIKAMLTPDQQTKFEAMQKEMRERRRDGGGPGGPGGPPPPPPSVQ